MTRIIKHILPFEITNVQNYGALPAANTVSGKYYYCRESQGTPYIGVIWGGSYYPNGTYYSDGINWIFTEIPFNASQAIVDAGTDDQRFLTSKTFNDSAQLAGKINHSLATASNDFLVGNTGGGSFIKKTLAQVKELLGIGGRTQIGDTNHIILSSEKRKIVTSAAFTSGRTWTLPSGLESGDEVIIMDEFQGISSANTLTVAAVAGKKLNGVTNGTEVMSTPGAWRRFIADGSDNFTFDAGIARISQTQTLTNKTINSSNNTIVTTEWRDFLIYGGGGVIQVSTYDVNRLIPVSETIQEIRMFSEDGTSGSITVDIYKNGASITGTGTKPNITAGTSSTQNTFTNWSSLSFAANDRIGIFVTSVTSMKHVRLSIKTAKQV